MRQSGRLEGKKGRDIAKACEALQPDIGTYSTVCCRIFKGAVDGQLLRQRVEAIM
jgi:hypothetical protein